MSTESVRERTYPLDGFLSALADDVGCTERTGESDAIGVTAEEDDLLGAEPARGDDSAESDRTVTDDRDDLSGCDLAASAAWWPVPITSVSVSRDGISA